MKRELEFEINGNILSVADFDVVIDSIDVVYIRNSDSGAKNEYSIFIQQDRDVLELFLRTSDEMLAIKEYNKLCAALKEVNPLFDNTIKFPVLINYANLKQVEYQKSCLQSVVNLKFNNYHLNIYGSKKTYDRILDKLNNVKESNKTI